MKYAFTTSDSKENLCTPSNGIYLGHLPTVF